MQPLFPDNIASACASAEDPFCAVTAWFRIDWSTTPFGGPDHLYPMIEVCTATDAEISARMDLGEEPCDVMD